jgi:thiol-disulfide isomerase/thioredoxin
MRRISSSSSYPNFKKGSQIERISAVIATWCPHCYPLSVDNVKRMGEELDIPIRVLDIDREDDVKIADQLVKEHGDDAEDYLIPQIFLEFKDRSIKHIFTGFSENTEITKRRWADLFKSKFYEDLKKASAAS